MKILIELFSMNLQEQTKNFILQAWKEFGFTYNKKYDGDLDDIYSFYIKSGGMLFVLKDGNDIIGTIGIINKGNYIAELKRFYIDINHRGRGFGSKLVEKALIYCKDKGFNKVEFETNKKFKIAHALYLKKGFKVVKEDIRSYYIEKYLLE